MIRFLPTEAPKPSPARGDVARSWNTRGNRVAITTNHRQFGNLYRGHITRIAPQSGDGVHARFQIIDMDAAYVGERLGDYLDAERQLLDATSALDEELSGDEYRAWLRNQAA